MRNDDEVPPVPNDQMQGEHGLACSTPAHAGERHAIRGLFNSLESSGARYCHWKSNVRLDKTLAGNTDIDLLVDPRDAHLLYRAILENGFKLTTPRRGISHPALFHAAALDVETATLVDLHAHFQVVTGDSYVKSYRFPIETDLLDRTELLLGVRVPTPAAELALFVVRMLLKHVSPLEIRKANSFYLNVVEELAWLRSRATDSDAADICAGWFPAIEPALFAKMIEAVRDRGALIPRIFLGYRLAWLLRGTRRLGLAASIASRTWRLLERTMKRRPRSLLSGGAIVALAGAKGTGKSTIGTELSRRLGRHLDVVRVHIGKPPATPLSRLPRLLAPVTRRLLPDESPREYEKTERREARRYSLYFTLRMVLLAYDRRRLIRGIQRLATAGTIVLTDRFPSSTAGAPDSSRFDDVALARCTSSLQRWLMEKERAIYRGLPQPRVVLRLFAPLEVAVRRDAERVKPGGPNEEAVRQRWTLETSAQFGDALVIDINTDAPLDATISASLQAVWKNL